MSDTLSPGRQQTASPLNLGKQRLSVIDCDIHPQVAHKDEIIQFMPQRWQEYARTDGGNAPLHRSVRVVAARRRGGAGRSFDRDRRGRQGLEGATWMSPSTE